MFNFIFLLVLTSSAVLGNVAGGRIIGGKDADIADYPYQLSLIIDDMGPSCGATLISLDWAVTAAHCTYGFKPDILTVRAGSTNSTSGGELVNVEAIFEHEHFDYETAENDIALLKFSSNVTVCNSQPIDLTTNNPEPGKIGTVTGWGVTDPEVGFDSIPTVLQVVQVPIVAQEDCKKAYADQGITDTMFCAGFLEEGGKDSCSGDSGGPLVVDGELAGVVSWGSTCAMAGKPGVYTDVSSYVNWVDEIMTTN